MIAVYTADKTSPEKILSRDERLTDVRDAVSQIIENVKKNGDAALKEYALRFDGASLDSLEVGEDEIEKAKDLAGKELCGIMEKAAENIKSFHRRQIRNGFIINEKNGVVLGQKIIPVEKAGIYVPGGTAAYPSTVLMDCIPAKLAGCGQVVMTTPPRKDGTVSPAVLAAARIAGVDRIFKTGGAQAIAALAYGTETVPAVDKIVGPGNAYVAEAKRQVSGKVGIDMIAGPSEILIISDERSSPAVLAADLLSQAEHDRMASAVLITTSAELAGKVSEEIEKQLSLLERKDIARESIDKNGRIIITKTLEEAVEISNLIAPEHLELAVEEPFALLDRVKNAGSVFLGRYCPEALGDYFAGPNHTLPTSGTARFSSPLSVDDFVKKTQITYFSREALKEVARDVEKLARTEGLTAHARSAVIRFEEDGRK
ncbi:MAG: histidinol dehydrogenase [Clostridia bacterium]|nr:histidinol dehydrogenase [Clostridia bacterium]